MPFDAKTVRRDKNFNFETSSKLLVSNIKQLDNQGRVAISSGFQRSNAQLIVEPDTGPGTSQHTLSSDLFNLRINYFYNSNVPVMEVKAWYCLTGELTLLRIVNKDHIKAIIRICGQTE